MYKLDGDVQIDDACLGGEKPGKSGKAGRGAEGKTPFIVAVETRDGKPVHAQMRLVPGFTKEAIQDYASASIARGSWAISDGLGCFPGLADAGLRHIPIVTGGGRPTNPLFKRVNTVPGNIKSAIIGACRSFDPQHAERYPAAFEWRFNRRFDLARNIERLARAALNTAPSPYRSIAPVRT